MFSSFEEGMWFLIRSELVFLVVIGVMVGLLFWVKSKVSVSKECLIDINDGFRKIKTSYSSKLFEVLSANGIYLPSACGGGGTCGMCKVKLDTDIEPGLIDKSILGRHDLNEGMRLACQMSIKQDIEIKLPSSVMNVKKRRFKVIENRQLTSLIYEIKLAPCEGEMFEFRVGDYIQVELERDGESYIRGYSMANSSLEKDYILLNIRLAIPPRRGLPVGVVSSFLTSRQVGDEVIITGPYGEFHISDTLSPMVYVAGGVGLSSIRAHIVELLEGRHSQRKISFWYGVRTLKDGYYTEDMARLNEKYPNFTFNLVLSNEKPSVKEIEENRTRFNLYTGFVHEALYSNLLKDSVEASDWEYYFCGPSLMNKGMIDLLGDLGVDKSNIYYDDFG